MDSSTSRCCAKLGFNSLPTLTVETGGLCLGYRCCLEQGFVDVFCWLRFLMPFKKNSVFGVLFFCLVFFFVYVLVLLKKGNVVAFCFEQV